MFAFLVSSLAATEVVSRISPIGTTQISLSSLHEKNGVPRYVFNLEQSYILSSGSWILQQYVFTKKKLIDLFDEMLTVHFKTWSHISLLLLLLFLFSMPPSLSYPSMPTTIHTPHSCFNLRAIPETTDICLVWYSSRGNRSTKNFYWGLAHCRLNSETLHVLRDYGSSG